jgi:hypothetical protein
MNLRLNKFVMKVLRKKNAINYAERLAIALFIIIASYAKNDFMANLATIYALLLFVYIVYKAIRNIVRGENEFINLFKTKKP